MIGSTKVPVRASSPAHAKVKRKKKWIKCLLSQPLHFFIKKHDIEEFPHAPFLLMSACPCALHDRTNTYLLLIKLLIRMI